MAFPVAAAITAGASLAGTAAGISSTGKLNKANRQWQTDMMHYTNWYNSPEQQMKRFEEAGLNPHLIYGQGNAGNMVAPSQPNQHVPNYNFADAAAAYVSTRKQQTEIDNMKKAQEVMDADKTLKNAQATNQLSQSAMTDQQREHAHQLWSTTVMQAEANLRNTNLVSSKYEAEIGQILASTEGTKQNTKESQARVLQIGQNIIESTERIKLMRAERNLKGIESELKNVELGLRRQGINPNDPAFMRILGRLLDETGLADKAIDLFKGDPDSGTWWNRVWRGLKTWYTK